MDNLPCWAIKVLSDHIVYSGICRSNLRRVDGWWQVALCDPGSVGHHSDVFTGGDGL